MLNPIVINPHGFCSGVMNAVRVAKKILDDNPGEKVYSLHQLVHNEMVVDELAQRGMVSVESIDEIPDGSLVLFSAHGVSPEIRKRAAEKKLKITDTTCPFVSRIHREVCDAVLTNKKVIVVGDSSHAEVKGVTGEVVELGGEFSVINTCEDVDSIGWEKTSEIRVVVQTTLSEEEVVNLLAAIKKRFPNSETSAASSVCTATRDRQKAVRDFISLGKQEGKKTGVLVLGSPNSANTKRLAKITEEKGGVAWLAGTLEEVQKIDFSQVEKLGITAGASTPETLINEVFSNF